MKKRHIGKVNIIPRKEKEMLKFLNDPKALEKLTKLGNIASSMSMTQKTISESKLNTIEEWMAYSLTYMSPSLFDKTKENGFQKEFQELVAKYSSLGETDNDKGLEPQ